MAAFPREMTHGGVVRGSAGWLSHALAALALSVLWPLAASAAGLDELPLDRWARLGENDRYQMNVAEKYYREQNWKAALSEYEKFLSLYEKSEGAPFAQLKWSMCQANLRKQNTAIKDGYQSVIDYWPDSPEAASAAYLIAKTYKDMAETKQAKKAYAKVLSDYPGTLVAMLTRVDLADIARVEGDHKKRLALLNEVVFNTEHKGDFAPVANEIGKVLAVQMFYQGDFAAGLKSLATSVPEHEQPNYLMVYIRQPIQDLVNSKENKATGHKLADAADAFLRSRLPGALQDDQQKNAYRQLNYWIAEIETSAGRPDKADEAFTRDSEKRRHGRRNAARRAEWLKQIGRRDEARVVFGQMKNAIEGQSQIAHSFREESKQGQAIPIYQQLIASDPSNTGRWSWELAHAYRESNQFKEAIDVYRQCDRFPEDVQQMAYCYRRLGDVKESVAMYQQVLAGAPQLAPWALLEIARTYEEGGQKDTAVKMFQQVCKRYPKSGEASQAQCAAARRVQNQRDPRWIHG